VSKIKEGAGNSALFHFAVAPREMFVGRNAFSVEFSWDG
jgi:hypothetical protein